MDKQSQVTVLCFTAFITEYYCIYMDLFSCRDSTVRFFQIFKLVFLDFDDSFTDVETQRHMHHRGHEVTATFMYLDSLNSCSFREREAVRTQPLLLLTGRTLELAEQHEERALSVC